MRRTYRTFPRLYSNLHADPLATTASEILQAILGSGREKSIYTTGRDCVSKRLNQSWIPERYTSIQGSIVTLKTVEVALAATETKEIRLSLECRKGLYPGGDYVRVILTQFWLQTG